LVRPYSRRRPATRTEANRRSIVRALITNNSASTTAGTFIRFLTQGSQYGINAFNRTDHG
jgi:hypothetical protein